MKFHLKFLLSSSLRPSSTKKEKVIRSHAFLHWAVKTFHGHSPATGIFSLLIFHSVCSWHLERRNIKYHKTYMAGEGHLLCTDWWIGWLQKASLSGRNDKPASSTFWDSQGFFSSGSTIQQPYSRKITIRDWTQEECLPQKALLSLQPCQWCSSLES